MELEKRTNESKMVQLTRQKEAAEQRAEKAETHIELQQAEMDALRANIRAITIADRRYKDNEAKRLAAEVEKFTNVCLKERGAWSQNMRRAIRRLFNIGCSIQGISQAFTTVCEAIHISIDDVPSVESVRRILYEGKVLAELHIVDELLHTTCEC